MYRGKYTYFGDYKGGYCGNHNATQLDHNQAIDLDNIHLESGGKGFSSRPGNSL